MGITACKIILAAQYFPNAIHTRGRSAGLMEACSETTNSSRCLIALPVVIDICGISCRQKKVHKEADMCSVRVGVEVACKLGKNWV